MLEQFSDRIRACYERAAEAKARADTTSDPALKVEFLDDERRWLTLARSYGFTESLEDFTAANSEHIDHYETFASTRDEVICRPSLEGLI